MDNEGKIMRINTMSYLIAAALVMPTLAIATEGGVLAHQGNGRGVPACSVCHGAEGQGNDAAGFPRLAGLNAAYLLTQLQDFAGGQRRNAIMMPIAKALSTQEMQSVAKYYADLPLPANALDSDAKPNPSGRAIAQHGRWNQGVPGCVQCHGPDGRGVGETFPSLAGQSSVYTSNQLHDWQQGKRPPGPLGLMRAVANKLSDTEINAVSTYFATLSPAAAGHRSAP